MDDQPTPSFLDLLKIGDLQLECPSLTDFIGQEHIKSLLLHIVYVCRQIHIPTSPILISGPAHHGKRALASSFAKETGACLVDYDAATKITNSDLGGLLTSLALGDVLLIENIERLDRRLIEHVSNVALVFRLDLIIDEGPNARSVRINLPRFVLVGTTTKEISDIPRSIRNIFTFKATLSKYTALEISQILQSICRKYGIELAEEAGLPISTEAECDPQESVKLLNWVVSYALARGQSSVNVIAAREAISLMQQARYPHKYAANP